MPDSRELGELKKRAAWRVDLKSEPTGARVLRRAYGAGEDAWVELGVTPLEDVYLPFGVSQLRLEREGSVPLLRAIGGGGLIFAELPERDVGGLSFEYLIGWETFKLDAVGSIPDGKVRVPGVRELVNGGSVDANDFFLDRYEVTNAQYKQFVDAGGYADARLWDPELPWDEVRKRFIDRTGRPGPSTWEGGDYPRGADDLPVTGVSWYEASAYARFKGQELPTIHHWQRAAAIAMQAWELPLSRFAADGPLPVGRSGAASWVGAFDLLGNAQEWTATRRGDEVFIAGGAWNDRQHLFFPLPRAPLDRGPGNGLRLAITSDEPATRAALRAPLAPVPAISAQEPVSDEIYAAYGELFAYEPTDLRAAIDATQETHAWTRQRISFDAAYPGPRMVLYLYLPHNSRPPYQTVIHWPGAAAWSMASIDDYTEYLDFVVKNGRAVAWPVYLGTFERGDGHGPPTGATNATARRDQMVAGAKDLRRTVDYLLTRQDIDSRALAFYGLSIGAHYGASALAQDNRISLAVMEVLPLGRGLSPAVDPVNALPRIHVPTLLMSGELDPYITPDDARRSFALLGADASDKKHVWGQGTHFIPRDLMIRETLEWLDKYFGPPPRDLSQTYETRPPSAGLRPAYEISPLALDVQRANDLIPTRSRISAR
jgi:dienelactone hydrolase